jgi:EAL and modified HD-GYP domain-containing signal transduction protein
MPISVTFNNAHKILLGSEFFMARRPVLNRQHELIAHELLFCHVVNGTAAFAQQADHLPTAASVIAGVCEHGMGRVLGELRGFVHIDAEALESDIFQFLPPQKIVLSIHQSITGAPRIVARIAELAQAGFTFALEVTADSEDVQNLLPMVDIVTIDITDKEQSSLGELCSLAKAHQKELLAEHVESIEQFAACFELGFDYFQGYYFSKLQATEGEALAPSQLAITELMALISTDADNAFIENSIKGDVSLGLNLLRLANTPAVSPHRIESLRQALMALGRNQLQSWLQIMLYAAPSRNGQSLQPLMMLATMRGRLLELVAQKTRPGNRGIADTAFTVGIMSLMDTLFGMPMPEILKQISVVEEVSDALLHRKGYYGDLLQLVEYTEWVEKADTLLLHAIASQRLTCSELYMLQLAAFEWSDHVTHSLR